MKGLRCLLTGCFLVCLSLPGDAQLFSPYNFRFKQYTTADGLVHNSIRKITSDRLGFIWLATENGLSRFDGYRFTNFQHRADDPESLPVNSLIDLVTDTKNRVYVAYRTGIAVLDPASGTFTTLRYQDKDIPAYSLCWSPGDSSVYIMTDKNLFRYSPHTRQLKVTAQQVRQPVYPRHLFCDRQGYLWTSIERKGYYRYDPKKDTAWYYDSQDWPLSFYQDRAGAYYMSTWGSGFQVFSSIGEEHSKKIYQLPLTDLPSAAYVIAAASEAPAITGDDLLWVVTQTSGLGLFSKSQKRFVHHFAYRPQSRNGFNSSFFWCLFPAKDGSLWIGSWHGLVKVTGTSSYFQSAELPELQSSLYNAITGIADDPYDSSKAWMAVIGDGIALYDKPTGKIIRRYFYDEKNGDNYYLERWPLRFFRDRKKQLWSATYGGLLQINRGQVQFRKLLYKDRVPYPTFSMQDRNGRIWLAGRYIGCFDPAVEQLHAWDAVTVAGSAVYFTGVCETAVADFFACGTNGLYRVDALTDSIHFVSLPGPLQDSAGRGSIRSVYAVGQVLYLGSTLGVFAWDLRSKKLSRIDGNNPVSGITNNAFYADRQERLWIYAANGLFRYQPSTTEFVRFGTEEGIHSTSEDPSFFFAYGPYTYLGTRMAYTRFVPDSVVRNQNIPVPYITSIHAGALGGNPSAGLQPLRMPRETGTIQFEFAAIEYNFPENLLFRTKLEGFDPEWSSASRARRREYTNLPPGSYRFLVKAINSDGVESAAIAAYTFSIRPAFWQTTAFRIAAGLLLLVLMYCLYRARIRRLVKRQEEKNKLQQVQLEQYRQQLEMEQITNYFTSSIADKKTQEEVIWDVARNLIQQLGFKDCMIYLWNADKTLLLQKAGYDQTGALGETDKPEFTVAPGQGVVGHVAVTKKPLLVNDTSKDPRYRPDGLVRGSELCVPALYGDELISVIDSEDYSANYYTAQHVQILTTIATLMAAKLVSVRADEEARIKQATVDQLSKQMMESQLEAIAQELETQQITNFFSGSLVRKNSIREVLQDVAKNLIGKLGFEDCMIYLWNADKTKLLQEAGHGIKGAIEHTDDIERYHIPAGKGIVGAAVAARQPLLINDTSQDTRYISADGILRYSELCVPIVVDDDVLGAINIEHTQKNFFTKRHIQTVSTIAALVASKIKALESSQALHQKQLELEKTNRQLAEREVAMLRSQMNPHFIFNSLNSVQKYIWENKEEDAAEYLASFAKLIRSILENSRYEYISLRQEIEFLKLYIDLENRRSNNNFNYSIKVDTALDPEWTAIPPMLLQPFIENAIWHGLNKKNGKGNLRVAIERAGDKLVCRVDDDGVGRQLTPQNKEKHSLGISITEQRIARLIANTSQSAAVTIRDKIDNGMPAGTEVTVILDLISLPPDA